MSQTELRHFQIRYQLLNLQIYTNNLQNEMKLFL